MRDCEQCPGPGRGNMYEHQWRDHWATHPADDLDVLPKPLRTMLCRRGYLFQATIARTPDSELMAYQNIAKGRIAAIRAIIPYVPTSASVDRVMVLEARLAAVEGRLALLERDKRLIALGETLSAFTPEMVTEFDRLTQENWPIHA